MTTLKKIVFPEGENPIIIKAAQATEKARLCAPILLSGENTLETAAEMLKNHQADTMIAGIDHISRDVILTAKNIIGMKGQTFSSIMLLELPDNRQIILSDVATCKHPTAPQLADIAILAGAAAAKLFPDPKIALLSFSTFGSGGRDPSIDLIHEALALVNSARPRLKIAGELQLDAAVNEKIARKKVPSDPTTVAGAANVLICPDINSANILYKALEQFARAKAYGPILLGFNQPLSDLSRGSTPEDVLGTIRTLVKLL
jgi:phosphotransacetylase